MITNNDWKIADDLEGLLYRMASQKPRDQSWEIYAEVVSRMKDNLKKAPLSYRPLNDEDKADRFYLAECDNCGWWGSSKLLNGGGAIADTGDHFDCTCPVCGKEDPPERVTKDEVLQPMAYYKL